MTGYSIIKGNLFRTYTGTVACTGIVVHKVVKTRERALKALQKLLDSEETDLAIIIDLGTGQEIIYPTEAEIGNI